MPRYDYKCPLCTREYTEVRGMNDPKTVDKCENCKIDLIRVYNVSIAFNGSGFYANDKNKPNGE